MWSVCGGCPLLMVGSGSGFWLEACLPPWAGSVVCGPWRLSRTVVGSWDGWSVSGSRLVADLYWGSTYNFRCGVSRAKSGVGATDPGHGALGCSIRTGTIIVLLLMLIILLLTFFDNVSVAGALRAREPVLRVPELDLRLRGVP